MLALGDLQTIGLPGGRPLNATCDASPQAPGGRARATRIARLARVRRARQTSPFSVAYMNRSTSDFSPSLPIALCLCVLTVLMLRP
ncbi:hypothetical protein X992_5277 [Burkholderia pseudomallei MSHR5492]|nr:hypothetical protein X992_5277 [Burkholderia pseudomallei MSHR5492]